MIPLGREAIIAIRGIESEHPDMRPVYIIAFTADLSDVSQQELISAGANEVMAKPTPAGQLEEAVLKLAE
jgi:CheY-like chemotaxis protein